MKNELIKSLNFLGSMAGKHLPSILVIFGTGLFGLTTYKVAEKTPEFKENLENLKESKDEVTLMDKAKCAVISYREPIMYGMGSLGCFYMANGINLKRLSAVATLYSAERRALENYAEAAEEIVGKSKAEKIKVKAQEKELDSYLKGRDPESVHIQNAKYGTDLFFIPEYGTMFRSDMERVRQAFDRCDEFLHNNDWCPVNKLYSELELENIGAGEKHGFDLDDIAKKNGYNPAKCKIYREFYPVIRNGHAVILIDIHPTPMKDWRYWDTYDNQFAYLYDE